jgi:hypothetical protein
MHIEVSGTGEGATFGVRKERIDHPGLLAAPDLLRDASERECLLPGRRRTVMGSHGLRRSTVLKGKMLLSIGNQAETRSSIRDDARDCRYTDLAVSGFETPPGAQGVSSLPSNHPAAGFFIHT